MAPLYKRYIPPKPGAATQQTAADVVSPAPAPPPKLASQAAQKEDAPKRKRERTDDEVAERKAKKLRKKGIDPATIEASVKITEQQSPQQPLVQNESTQANGASTVNADTPAAQGEFSYVKDSRKRHKLEKEARKARIAAEKQAKTGTEAAETDKAEAVVDGDGGQSSKQQQPRDTFKGLHNTVETTEAPSEKAKRKKRRKDQKEGNHEDTSVELADAEEAAAFQRGAEAESAEDHGENDTAHEDGGRQYGASLSRPKKRRHKLEGVLAEPSAAGGLEAEDENDTDHLRKHGAIMGKFQKSQKLAETGPATEEAVDEELRAEQPILRDIVPLPQPEKALTPEFRPDPNALPPWLARPTIVTDDNKSTFEDLGLDAKVIQHLSHLHFQDALPVQQTLIPLLLAPGMPGSQYLPGSEPMLPDVAVGAPTGSGKTLAYLLPIIEALKKHAESGNLKALVVVPTRELVMQVAAVAESLAKGSRVKVGVATGSSSFADEQARIIKQARRYDPEGYRRVMRKAQRLNYPPSEHPQAVPETADTSEAAIEDDWFEHQFEQYLDEIDNLDAKEQQLIRNTVSELVDHIPAYESAVDLLVATPGRLLEHLDSTLGFSLDQIECLVLDEADKLLDGQYSNFLQTINEELERSRPVDQQNGRERYLRSYGRWREDAERRVRKVVLSATMTRDISKLMELKLKRPQMLVVRGSEPGEQVDGVVAGESVGVFELPPGLREHSVHTGDGSEKPLFFLQVLKDRILHVDALPAGKDSNQHKSNDESESSASDESSSDTSNVDSGSSAGGSDDNSAQSDVNESEDRDATNALSTGPDMIHPDRSAALSNTTPAQTILIFTSSTESAARLSHLLSTLTPHYLPTCPAPTVLTLTSTTATTPKALRKHLSHTSPHQPVLAITTDRAARGLDALASRPVTHVVQYDVPRSAVNYVHRVGRTARAGREGEAWTLFTHSEARWFVGEIVRGKGIRRVAGGGVERVAVKVEDEGLREEFERAVRGLREGVLGSGRGKEKKR